MKIRNKSLLLLTFFAIGVIIPLQLSFISVNALDINASTINTSSNEVSPGDTVEVIVHAVNVTGDLINTDVFFEATDGDLQGSGTSQLVQTNSTGYAVVTWTAPFVDFTNDTSVSNITAQIQNGAQIKDLFQLITVKHLNTDFIANSAFTDPSPIVSNQKKELVFTVEDNNNNPAEGMQVTATELTALGNFTEVLGSDITGLSDENGLFKFNWTAPILLAEDIEVNIQFEFFIEAGVDANLTVSAEFFVTKFDATDLTVDLTSNTDVETGQTVLIDISVFAGVSPAENANITLTVDQGQFNNSDTQIILTIGSTGLTSVNFTSPVVTTNTTVTISGDAELLSLIGQDTLDILVYVVERDFEATIDFSGSLVKQNESLTVTVTVTDSETNLPVIGATVSFLTELGIWDESTDALYSPITNALGVATATFNGTNTAMIFQIQQINVTATISAENYAQFEIVGSFSLEKLPDVFDFTVTASLSEVDYGSSITITIKATINGLAYNNATLHFFATGGSFDDGSSDYRTKTDSQGNLVVTWDSSTLPQFAGSLQIFIEIDLVNSGLAKQTVELTVNGEDNTSPQQTTDGDGGDDDPIADPLVIGAIVGVLALGGIAVVVSKRGS